MAQFKAKDARYDISSIIENYDSLIVDKFIFDCREQWMMAHKALIFAKGSFTKCNMVIFYQIMSEDNPNTIRALGRNIKNYNEKIWTEWKYKVVVNGNYLQFSQDEQLKKTLLDTGTREIVEASPYDKIWGIGLNEADARRLGKANWKGTNLLGKGLMEVRELLKY